MLHGKELRVISGRSDTPDLKTFEEVTYQHACEGNWKLLHVEPSDEKYYLGWHLDL